MRKVWRQLLREGMPGSQMYSGAPHGGYGTCGCVVSGVKRSVPTISRKAVAAGDRVNREFVAERPDQLWVADLLYVSTWQG